MQTPGIPLSHSIESVAAELFYGKPPDIDQSLELSNSANLQSLRDEAYRANSARAADTRRSRVVAWSVGRAALDPEVDNPSTVRLAAVLRLPYLFNRFVTPATLEVREFLEPELSEDERLARLANDTNPIIGLYTTYRTNPFMDRLVVARGPLTLDKHTNRGVKWSHLCNMQADQPELETVTKPKDYIEKVHIERLLEKIDAGAIGNLLVPTVGDVKAFEHELERGATGNFTTLPPLRAW